MPEGVRFGSSCPALHLKQAAWSADDYRRTTMPESSSSPRSPFASPADRRASASRMSVIGPDDQLLLLLVGGPPRLVTLIKRHLTTRIGVAMAAVEVRHTDEAVERVRGGGFDGVIVFDDLVGRATMRSLQKSGDLCSVVCVVERAEPPRRAELRAQMRHEGALSCVFAEELDAALLELAVLHAIEMKRALDEKAHSRATREVPGDHDRYLRQVSAALARAQVDASYRFRIVHLEARALEPASRLHSTVADAIEEALLRRLRDTVDSESFHRNARGHYSILVEDDTHNASDLETLEAVRRLALAAYEVGGRTYHLDAGLGVARGSAAAGDAEALIRRAEEAAKTRGSPTPEPPAAWRSGRRPTVALFEGARLHTALRDALDRGEFSLAYQPIVHLETEELVALEGLIRWNDGQGNDRTASDFIPNAERSELIVPIGYWALETAVKQMSEWERDFELGGRVPISINLSVRQCTDPTLAARVASLLMTTGLRPGSLKVEIGEGAIVSEPTATRRLIRALADHGVGTWIEDFGTGSCTVDNLRQVPVEALKIDRALLDGLDGTSSTTGRVRHVSDAANALGAKLMAEGVENRLQANVLRWIGCQVGQGFLFAKPLPVGDVFACLAKLSR